MCTCINSETSEFYTDVLVVVRYFIRALFSRVHWVYMHAWYFSVFRACLYKSI